MSVNLYGIIETYDRKKGKWEKFTLYQKSESGGYVEVDAMTGGRSCVEAVLGREDFDYLNIEDGEDEFSTKGQLLDMIQLIIQSATSFDVKNQCSQETLEKLEVYWSGGEGRHTAVYTHQDIKMIELLAKRVSPSAEGYFEQYFRHIDAIMRVVNAAKYLYSDKDVRVILFGV